MKHKRRTIIGFALLGMLAGCAPQYSAAPTAKNFATTDQNKLQASAHWNIVATDISTRLKANMAGKVRKQQALYVSSRKNSAFNQAVVAELIASLVNDGYLVAKSPTNTIKVDVDTQLVSFLASRSQPKPLGLASALATGVWVLSAADVNVTAAGVATAAVFGSEAYAWHTSDQAAGPTPKTEITVNVSVSDNNEYLAVSKETYYIADTDRQLYEAVQTKNFAIRSDL